MSKIEAQRAMWKQRYERRQAAAAAQPTSTAARAPAMEPAREPAIVAAPQRTDDQLTEPDVPVPDLPVPDATVPDATEPAEELCGHRNIGGRTCTRERGHAAKSHRYSP
ncbi:MAG: hypothetical protein ABWZ91_15040 [Nocardioides sp.]